MYRSYLAPSWLSDIKKVAFITFSATVLSLLIPIGRLTQQTPGYRLPVWEKVSFILFGYVFGAIMPTFYFALYRNKGTLRIPKNLRLLSLISVRLWLLSGLELIGLDRISWILWEGNSDDQVGERVHGRLSFRARCTDD